MPFDVVSDGIDFDEDYDPIWEQDVFVIKHDSYGLSKERIEKLEQEHAPFVFLDEDEYYLPASKAYLLSRDEAGKIKDEDLRIDVSLQLPNTKYIHLDYNDLSDVYRDCCKSLFNAFNQF